MRHVLRLSVFLAAILGLAAGPASARTERIGPVAVNVPAGWQSEMSDGALLMAPPDGSGVVIVLPASGAQGDARAGVQAIIAALASGETITQQSAPQDLPGLAHPGALGGSGSRMADGTMVYRLVAVLSAPGGAPAFVLAAADEARLTALTDAYLGIIASAEIGGPAVTMPPAVTLPPAVIAPPAGPGQLSGVYYANTQYTVTNDVGVVELAYRRELFHFSPDGSLARGMGDGDARYVGVPAACALRTAAQCGRYAISGTTISLSWGDGSQESLAFDPAHRAASGKPGLMGLKMGRTWLYPVAPLPDGTVLAGVHSFSGETSMSPLPEGMPLFFIFTADGRVVQSTNRDLIREPVGAAQFSADETGRYAVSGGRLVLTFANGRQASAPIFRNPLSDDDLVIAGTTYRLFPMD